MTMGITEIRCSCNECRSHTLADCINSRCECCDLEDIFAVISRQESSDLLLA